MTIGQETLTKRVMKWPARRRIELAEELLASVECFATPEIQAAWDEEIGTRVGEIRAGRALGIPAEAVMAEARQKLHETRQPEAEDKRQQRLACRREEVEKGFTGPATPWTKNDAERVRQLITEHARPEATECAF